MCHEQRHRKLLRNLEEILDYCGISEDLFRKFHENGLPARKIEGRWFSHKDGIDQFFKSLTKAGGRGPQEKRCEPEP